MKLCMFTTGSDSAQGYPGRIEGDRVIQLGTRNLETFFAGGGSAAETAEHALADVRLLAPIGRPPALRDFSVFEQHVKTVLGQRGLDVPPGWYQQPIFYFSNPAAIYGPDEVIPYPTGTAELDYELEAAVVIGVEQRIAGFTILNDWSARDVQRLEAQFATLGKCKDFATSLGPVVVTPDELGDLRLEMTALVNGEERSRGNLGDMHFSWDTIVEHASRDTRLLPGDVIGSGTVGSGSILEHGDGRWLKPGDVVELAIQGIGLLSNTVGPRRD